MCSVVTGTVDVCVEDKGVCTEACKVEGVCTDEFIVFIECVRCGTADNVFPLEYRRERQGAERAEDGWARLRALLLV